MRQLNLRHAGALLVAVTALLAFCASPAMAAGPPIVSIGATAEHSLNTALVNGTVDKNGASNVTYKFEYGKSKLYGLSTPALTTSAAGAVAINEVLSGLESLSTYHVRVSATNSYGTTTSEDLQFEMLLSWKVEGKRLDEMSEPVPYWGRSYTLPKLTIKGKLVGLDVEILCNASKNESLFAHAYLGSYHPMAFEECKAFGNGEALGCKMSPLISMNLGPTLVAESPVTIKAEGCALTENIAIGQPGFALNAMPEEKNQLISMTAKAAPNKPSWKMTATISDSTWILLAEQVGKKFGIS